MGSRIGLGPVFAYEWLTTARRWQVYAVRALFVSALLAAIVAVWLSEVDQGQALTTRAMAKIGQSLYFAIVGTQLALVLLAAPAATAGSICLDRARGTLAHLMVTDLSDAEILLGKLAARLIPVVGLVACALPVMALGTLLGGIDPEALTAAFLVTLGTAILSCTLALFLSVWGTKTHEVLLASYAILLIWVLGNPSLSMLRWASGWGWELPEWFSSNNPFWLVFAPYNNPGAVGLAEIGIFLAATMGISAFLATLAVVRLRTASTRLEGRPQKANRRWSVSQLVAEIRSRIPGPRLPGPSLDRNPVLWREWHRNRPTRWARVLWAAFWGASIFIGFTEFSLFLGGSPMGRAIGTILVAGQVAVGFLMLSVTASTALAEERTRGSLDVLLATPLSTPTILWGKWWGSFRTVVLLTILPSFVGTMAALTSGRVLGPFILPAYILVLGAALTSLGLALATWVSRLGRAMGLSVAAYVLVTVGWFLLALLFTQNSPGMTGPGLASASPFIGTMFPLIEMIQDRGPPNHWEECVSWMGFWIVFYAVVASVLMGLTLATFDRCLGRLQGRDWSFEEPQDKYDSLDDLELGPEFRSRDEPALPTQLPEVSGLSSSHG